MTPKSSYRRSRLAPRLIKAIVEAKVGELQETLFELTQQRDNLQRSIVNGNKKVTMNVQRLENEDFLPINSPRAPTDLKTNYDKNH